MYGEKAVPADLISNPPKLNKNACRHKSMYPMCSSPFAVVRGGAQKAARICAQIIPVPYSLPALRSFSEEKDRKAGIPDMRPETFS